MRMYRRCTCFWYKEQARSSLQFFGWLCSYHMALRSRKPDILSRSYTMFVLYFERSTVTRSVRGITKSKNSNVSLSNQTQVTGGLFFSQKYPYENGEFQRRGKNKMRDFCVAVLQIESGTNTRNLSKSVADRIVTNSQKV